MNKLTTKRLFTFLLALVMIFGTISPAFAAGYDASKNIVQKTESELISKDGKLRAKLVVPQKQQVQTRSKRVRRALKAPTFNETTVKVNIAKHGIGTNPFNFDAVFGTSPNTKVTLINWDTEEKQEATFNKDSKSITFDNPVSMQDMEEGVYGIEFEGTNVAGKFTFEESSEGHSGGSNITTFTLELYQVRNTDVIVKTVDAEGTKATNPTTAATNGKIKLTAGTVTETINIPAGNDATETVKSINTRNKDEINKGVAFTIEGTENGVLVDKTAKKVYKPEVKVDPDGLKATEITFTEKPIVTETEPKIDDPENPGTQITDPDYIAVTFAQGDHGTIAENKTYYVFKGVEMKAALGAPEVTPNKDWKHTGWDPALATKYDSKTEHKAQYSYTGEDVVPQKPGEEKPDVPADFVKVEFKAGDNGTFEKVEGKDQTTIFWVNPTAKKKVSDLTKPTVTANDGWKHTGWDKADTEEITDAMDITAQYKKKVVTEDPQDTTNYAHVTFTTTKGTVSGQAEYWVLKNETVSITAPTVNMGTITDYTFKAWDPAVKTTYAEDTVHNATFNYTGNDIVPQPGDDKPNVPDNFVLVEFKAGDHGTLEGTTKYWVNPDAGKTLENIDKPTVTPEGNWTHTGWDKADTTAITEALKVTAQYTQNPSIVANPVQKYDEATDNQYIEGVLPEGKTLPADAKVELVVKNGDNYEKVDVPVTTDGGVIKVNVKDDNIQHGGTYYFAITEEGKTTSYSEIPVKVDKQGPTLGTPGNEITLAPDAYGYQVKVSANASDDSGILRVYAEKDKSADNSYYDEDASKTTAKLSESIQNQLGVEKEFTVTAVDKFGNKTEVKKTAEATGTPIMIKAERPLDGDDFIYVTTDEGANLEITVINQDKTTAFTMTHIQGQPSEEIKLVGTDGAFKLTKGQRVKVKGSLEGKEDNTLTIRVR